MTAPLLSVLAMVAVWLVVAPAPLERLEPARERAGEAGRKAVAVGVLIVIGTASPAGAVLGGLLCFGILLRLFATRSARPDRRMVAQLPDALDFLAVVLEAGAPVPAAVQAVADISPHPTADLLHRVARSMQLGADAGDSWDALASHLVWGRAAGDLARSARSGTTLAGTLRMHAAEARQEHRDRTIKAARTVGVKSVLPLMVCFLPAFVLVGVVPIVVGLLGGLIG